MTKRMIRVLIDSIKTHGSVDYILSRLNYLTSHNEGKLEYEIHSVDEIGDSVYFNIYSYKEEPEESYQKRIASEKAEYERLKAKFGE